MDSATTLHPRPNALAFALALAALGSIPATSRAAPSQPNGSILWQVENCNESGPGSLRDVAAHARHGDGIDLSALACSTISLTSGAIALPDVELAGPGATTLTIDGAGNGGKRIFDHAGNGGILTIRDLTVRGAKYESVAGKGGACLRSTGSTVRISDAVFDGCLAFAPVGTGGAVRGGAIAVYGNDTTLSRVTLSGNQVRSANGDALGGGLYAADGFLTIEDSTITGNSATTSGASSAVHGGGFFTRGWAFIDSSTLDGNVSEGFGGGAVVRAGGWVVRSTISNNASVGGASGIAFHGAQSTQAGVYSSTITGNETEASNQWLSGALYMNTSPAVIRNSTIAGNIESNVDGVSHGAGILFGLATSQYLTISSTIVHGNHLRDTTIGADIGGPLGYRIEGSNNLIGVSLIHVPYDTLHDDPQLGPLQDNGGPTRTRMPGADGGAIDRGDDNDAGTDQRGFPRIQGLAADIGAVEAPPSSDLIFRNGFDHCVGLCP